MTAEQFCYWLQGLFELTTTWELSEEQLQVIEEHLNLALNIPHEKIQHIVGPYMPNYVDGRIRTVRSC